MQTVILYGKRNGVRDPQNYEVPLLPQMDFSCRRLPYILNYLIFFQDQSRRPAPHLDTSCSTQVLYLKFRGLDQDTCVSVCDSLNWMFFRPFISLFLSRLEVLSSTRKSRLMVFSRRAAYSLVSFILHWCTVLGNLVTNLLELIVLGNVTG